MHRYKYKKKHKISLNNIANCYHSRETALQHNTDNINNTLPVYYIMSKANLYVIADGTFE